MEEKRIVKPWQAGLMLLVGIAVIIVGLLVMKLNNRIVLALDGVIMCLMAWCFGIPYAELQQGIKETVSSMIVAILILLAVGVLVGTWMASGTVPVMIYYGMKVLTPGLFLPVVCILCTLMSTMAGTSWGTLATVGVACMGVAQGLGVPLPAAAGAVCTGAFFGDKVSPLSDSPVITATVCEVPLMDGIRHALISTGPAYLISLVFYFVYGLRYSGGSVGGEVYEDILSTVSAEFWLSPVLLLPVLVVVVLMSYAQLTSISADVVSMQKELKTLDAEHVALLTQYERTFDLETVKAAAVAAGMNKPSSSQINYIDLSAPDSVELCEAQNVSVLSRVFTSLGQGVFSVVEYFS